jgi:hypothetical protein
VHLLRGRSVGWGRVQVRSGRPDDRLRDEASQRPAHQSWIASLTLAMTKRSRGASVPEFCLPPCDQETAAREKAEGGGAPKGASNQCPRIADSLRKLSAHGSGPISEAARLPALHRGACRSDRTLQLSPGRASREGEAQALPAPPIALKRGTPRPGRSAKGDDARTARRLGDEPRPQEPHPLHQSAATG